MGYAPKDRCELLEEEIKIKPVNKSIKMEILQWFPLTVSIFLFNQQLLCGPQADLLKSKFINSFHAQFVTVPFLIINTYISAQIYLKISKLRPEYDGDDLYEVTYGGDSSSTKKIDVS
ncbi:hypothetical protein CRE_23355 [Caenorhabditis remanei]|uniref:Uncharacterized protein n=1 Tax=Caenorhabditis remanei TaxID=31234 RepID=E3MH21_CAERE|nr:hypothetical protein CRE_23355 [Caenorhabditis remanei]